MFRNLMPGSADDWLARAEGDLAIAKAELPEGAFYEDYREAVQLAQIVLAWARLQIRAR